MSPAYLRRVLENMGELPQNKVLRFGVIGTGVNPDYRVQAPDGSITLFRGDTHRLYRDAPESMLTEARFTPKTYTYQEIEQMLGSEAASDAASKGERVRMTYPHEQVTNCDYFRDVLGTMIRLGRDTIVRFGIMGEGVRPNYQVQASDGSITPFRGNNHRPFLDAPEDMFAPERITPEAYTFEQVQQMLAKCIEKNRGDYGNGGRRRP